MFILCRRFYIHFLKDMSKVVVTMSYDKYEATFGDGFYPQMKSEGEGWESINIEFTLSQDGTTWKQSNEKSIRGLDGNCGDLLLAHLNSQAGANATLIFSHYDKIFPKK